MGLTQAQLGDRLGVSARVVGAWERGETKVPLEDYLIPLSRTFHIQPTRLVRMDKQSVDEYMKLYDANLGFTDFALANPELMEMVKFMVNKWDGNFAALVRMAFLYALLDCDDRSDISFMVGMDFRRKYEYRNNNSELVKLGLSILPEFTENWNEVRLEGDKIRREKYQNITP